MRRLSKTCCGSARGSISWHARHGQCHVIHFIVSIEGYPTVIRAFIYDIEPSDVLTGTCIRIVIIVFCHKYLFYPTSSPTTQVLASSIPSLRGLLHAQLFRAYQLAMPPSRGQVTAPDEMFRESSIPALPCKVYDNVEEGDDYDSSEDIYSESSQPSFPSAAGPVFRDTLDPGVGRKRPASVSEYIGALVETKRAKLSSTSTMIPKPSLCPILPQALWAEIFCFLPPTDLARQRRTCGLFQRTLEDESIWRQSRKYYLPDHPRPVFGLTEWEMLCIMWGKGCMLCEDGSNRRSTSLKDSATAYWQFRVRCCKGCLVENTTKVRERAITNLRVCLLTLISLMPVGIHPSITCLIHSRTIACFTVRHC